jgi:hypothetical protein
VTIDVDALKQSIDLVSLVGHFTPLKKRGAEYVGLCVAHNDHDPSMWVQPQKGFVHCFSCGFSADAISFVQHVEGLDFKAACERLGAKPQWTPIAPVAQKTKATPKPERITSKPPAEQATPSMSTRELGEPQMIFPLRDLDGAILGYECRYAVENGKKEIRMWTWGARGDAEPSWGCGHFNAPRPLYGLERLVERPEAPVSIFEGPKKAEAGKRLLPPYACISWTGGANAWHKHDWKPLAGRKVLLWPDADEAGWTACDKLAALLTDPRGLACSVRIVDTNRMPEGWDVADAEAEGWDTLKLIEWAKPRAKDYAPAIAKAAPPEPPEEPKARKPKLAVVGNTALAPEEDAEPLPDDALADAFADGMREDWRYVAAWGRWYEWTGDRWLEDQTGKHRHLSRMVTRQAIYWKDAQNLTPDGRRKINSARTAGALLQLAQYDRRIAAKVDQWDTEPWLLGVPGGVVDLRTCKTLEPVREQYITAQCAVAPAKGAAPRWVEFLQARNRQRPVADRFPAPLRRLLAHRQRARAFADVPVRHRRQWEVRVHAHARRDPRRRFIAIRCSLSNDRLHRVEDGAPQHRARPAPRRAPRDRRRDGRRREVGSGENPMAHRGGQRHGALHAARRFHL